MIVKTKKEVYVIEIICDQQSVKYLLVGLLLKMFADS